MKKTRIRNTCMAIGYRYLVNTDKYIKKDLTSRVKMPCPFMPWVGRGLFVHLAIVLVSDRLLTKLKDDHNFEN